LTPSLVNLMERLSRLGVLWLCAGLWPWLAAQAQVEILAQNSKLMLPAYWFKADAQEPLPVVIALHGCGGALDAKGQLNPLWRRYAGYFNAERMHFVVLDSFSPRGQTSICATPSKQRTIHEEDRREDVFAAMVWLARQPGVDESRIMVVGWSHGAQTVLSVMDASDKYVQTQMFQPKAAAAFYPGCTKFLKPGNYRIQTPLLVMSGELDDWTPASPCAALRDQVLRRQVQAPFDLVVYPDSYHGFDGVAEVRTRDNVGNTRSGKATVGGNPLALKASHARLFEFVAAQVGEPLRLSHEERLKVPPSPLPK
jgi:dienelactone hydrolase